MKLRNDGECRIFEAMVRRRVKFTDAIIAKLQENGWTFERAVDLIEKAWAETGKTADKSENLQKTTKTS